MLAVSLAMIAFTGALTLPGPIRAPGLLGPAPRDLPRVSTLAPEADAPSGVVWPTYLFDVERTGYNPDERTVAPSNVTNLTEDWTLPENGSDFSAPIVVGGTLFYGSWNGYEYAVNTSSGSVEWSQYLGIDDCGGYSPMGISSTPAYQNGTLYLGGGDGYWYALNATSGSVEWKYFLGAPPTLNNYDWASALVFGHSLYIGVASCFDNPLIQGQLLEVNLTGPHAANHTFDIVPDNQTGGSIWTSPTLDPANDTIWVSTGNEGDDTPAYPPYVNALIGLNATTLALKGSWQIPSTYQGTDSDFGSTPTLFSTASGIPMVVATNKDGIAYAFNRSNVSTDGSWNPAWTLDTGGGFSSGAFDGHTLYLAGDGLYAVDPSNGSVLWENAAVAGVYSALTVADGVVYAASGDTEYAVDAVNGTTLWTAVPPGEGSIVAEGVVADGRLYVPSGDYATEGNLTAYGLPLTGSATGSPRNGTAPLTVQFRAEAEGGLLPYQFHWSFGDGTSASGVDPAHTYATAGDFTARVWVNDSAGASRIVNLSITVGPQVPDPNLTAVISATPTIGVTPVTVVFNGSEQGGILPPYAYRWTFGQGGTFNGSSFTHVFAAPGNYPVTLTVSDRDNNTASGTVSIGVVGPLSASVGIAYVNGSTTCSGGSSGGTGPVEVRLTAVPVGGVPPLRYAWSFSNGKTATGPTVFLNLTAPVTANLTVTDAQDHTANVVQPVPIPSSGCPAPAASSSFVEWVALATVGAAVVIAAVALLLLRRKRRSPPAPAESPQDRPSA